MTASPLRDNWIIGLLRKHPALLVSVVYVIASTIGMLYSWDFLRLFGINVFNYAQIGDFLLAGRTLGEQGFERLFVGHAEQTGH